LTEGRGCCGTGVGEVMQAGAAYVMVSTPSTPFQRFHRSSPSPAAEHYLAVHWEASDCAVYRFRFALLDKVILPLYGTGATSRTGDGSETCWAAVHLHALQSSCPGFASLRIPAFSHARALLFLIRAAPQQQMPWRLLSSVAHLVPLREAAIPDKFCVYFQYTKYRSHAQCQERGG
jgi:hypothetical protein